MDKKRGSKVQGCEKGKIPRVSKASKPTATVKPMDKTVSKAKSATKGTEAKLSQRRRGRSGRPSTSSSSDSSSSDSADSSDCSEGSCSSSCDCSNCVSSSFSSTSSSSSDECALLCRRKCAKNITVRGGPKDTTLKRSKYTLKATSKGQPMCTSGRCSVKKTSGKAQPKKTKKVSKGSCSAGRCN